MLRNDFKLLFVSLITLQCILTSDALTCIQCEKTDDCLKNIAGNGVSCPAETSVCYTKIHDDGSVSRGCLLESDAECKAQNQKCVTCSSENCNNNNICKACDSTTDPNCAQTDASNVANEICANSNTKCMINVLASKTERGCATTDIEKKCSADEKKCKMCEGGVCNVGIFPVDRLRCYQCKETDASCANAQTSITEAVPCLLHVEGDKCYMYGSDKQHVTRGCTSDATTANKCGANADEHDDKCKTCDAGNCNDWAYKMDQSMKCLSCTSKDNAQCVWGQMVSDAKSCEQKILYTAEPKCYTRTDENDVVSRGCFYDLDVSGQAACAEGKNCSTCTDSNGCNRFDAKNFTCIRCRSDNYNGCLRDAKAISGEKCRNVVASDADAKCFAGVWNNGVVIRGCFIDLEPRDQFTCSNSNNNNCYICDGTNCNTRELANGAASLLFSNGLLLAVGVFAVWRHI